MSLRDVILSGNNQFSNPSFTSPTIVHSVIDHSRLRQQIHAKLLDQLNLDVIEKMSEGELKIHLQKAVEGIIFLDKIPINENDITRLVHDIQNGIIGLGPLEMLLSDTGISDILVNNYDNVYIERKGKLERSYIHFDSDDHLLKIIEKIVARVGRRIDMSSPMVDARLPDGSRVNAIIPPLAMDGPCLSIRRFSDVPLSMSTLIGYGTLTEKMAIIISALVKAKTNILVSGGTGSGKTTFLNIMSGFIPDNERIITIEDAAELRLQQPHVVRLETRPPNVEGVGEVTQRALVKNCLRMRPDGIILGEVRGIEVLDMLQAMNTGHEGSLTTLHANSARDALTRLENMVGLAGMNVIQKSLRQQIVSAIGVVIHTARLSDGRRKVMSIHEVTGMEGEVITLQEIFGFEQLGVASDGTVQGKFRATGIRPRFSERLASRGIPLGDYLFDPDSELVSV